MEFSNGSIKVQATGTEPANNIKANNGQTQETLMKKPAEEMLKENAIEKNSEKKANDKTEKEEEQPEDNTDEKKEEEDEKTVELESSPLHDMDAVFERVGGAGRYSVFAFLVMLLAHSQSVAITLSPVFTTVQLPFNCTEGQPPVRLFDSNNSAVFEETAASRFGLVCDRAALANMPTTCYFLGYLFGCSIYGALADRIGRMRVVQISLVNMALCIIGASQAPYLWLYCIMQVMTGFGDGGITSSGMTYAVECTDVKHRGLWALNVYHGVTIGTMVFTLIAYCVRHYQLQLLCAGLSCLIYTLSLFLLCESPRWLASVGRYADADRVMRRFDRLNNAGRPGGLRLPANFSTEAMVARQQQTHQGRHQQSGKGSFQQLLCQATLRRRTLSVWLLLFTVSIAYFGVALGVGRLGGDVFVNQLASASVEPVSRLLCALASLRVGRRPSVCCSFGLAGVCLLATAVLGEFPELVSWRVGIAMMGKFFICMAFDLSYLYANEVFPTTLRSAGVGSGSSVSRAGALTSTIVPALGALWGPLPFLVFATGPLAVAAAAPWLLTETRGRHLPELEEMIMEQRDSEVKMANGEAGDAEETLPMVLMDGDRNDHLASNGKIPEDAKECAA